MKSPASFASIAPLDLDTIKPQSAFHTVCICERPGAVTASHTCSTCGHLHPDAIHFAIAGTPAQVGWMGPFVAMMRARLA